ncbi:hypothetical protein FKG94_13780 [Exilibacterium tricleocarpae]|uniref:PepSY domain-containing protein n=1 Tax=Exilibacterium tricleocarpae TaxID=2591008 RepID=A0A545TLS3_9GAMM|nr:hypothetical protein [Exilibacterium tricleocarpae]TQV78144.1 hypothetical protein FKG94_13780 [Exilibacterium tricleocarpae]
MKTTMIPARRARKLHRRLNLIIGLQVLLWSVSGFYMVVVKLDFIRGNHLVQHLDTPLAGNTAELVPTTQLLNRFEQVESISLRSVLDHPHYILKAKAGSYLIDAVSGTQRSPVDAAMATTLAQHYYSGDASVTEVTLISANPPSELYSRSLPLWRVNFDDRINTSFYIDPHTAQLITRRHDFWRIFDFFWMLHIMDYDDRSDVDNNLLRAAILLGIASLVTGTVLLFYNLRTRRQQRLQRR